MVGVHQNLNFSMERKFGLSVLECDMFQCSSSTAAISLAVAFFMTIIPAHSGTTVLTDLINLEEEHLWTQQTFQPSEKDSVNDLVRISTTFTVVVSKSVFAHRMLFHSF